MDESPKHHGKRKKSGAKDYILYVIYLIPFNWNPRKGKSGCLGQRMGRKGMTELAWGYLLSDENIYIFFPLTDCYGYTTVYISKSHLLIQFKCVIFIRC